MANAQLIRVDNGERRGDQEVWFKRMFWRGSKLAIAIAATFSATYSYNQLAEIAIERALFVIVDSATHEQVSSEGSLLDIINLKCNVGYDPSRAGITRWFAPKSVTTTDRIFEWAEQTSVRLPDHQVRDWKNTRDDPASIRIGGNWVPNCFGSIKEAIISSGELREVKMSFVTLKDWHDDHPQTLEVKVAGTFRLIQTRSRIGSLNESIKNSACKWMLNSRRIEQFIWLNENWPSEGYPPPKFIPMKLDWQTVRLEAPCSSNRPISRDSSPIAN